MATTQIEEKPRIITPRNSRRNEIIAILLLALSLLLALCLISAAFNPNDPSWNSVGQTDTRNWAGSIGAGAAAALFQTIGLAAYLVPVLLLAASWRRFRTRSIHAPWSRVIGLGVLVVSAAALLSISGLGPLFDASVQPGGLIGTIIAQLLAGGLNTVGATVLLIAIAATGLLLVTNISFVAVYEGISNAASSRFAFISRLPARFKTWQQMRQEQTRLKKEKKLALQAEQEAARSMLKGRDLSPADRVAEFMKTSDPPAAPATTVLRSEGVTNQVSHPAIATHAAAAAAVGVGAGLQRATVVESRSGRRSIFPAGTAVADEAAEVEAMVKGASVLRTRVEAPAAEKLPFDAARRVSYSDYTLPPLEFLNEAPPHSEQADAELLSLATRLAEKCKEFNVTGQIKHICPGPVVTTYEFKPDPGVKYSRVVSLVDDLCLALKAESIRIDRMPGKPHVGIEVPNARRETIFLREVIESRVFRESASRLTIALGKTIDGLNYIADLAKMPHLLIAGTSGAGIETAPAADLKSRMP